MVSTPNSFHFRWQYAVALLLAALFTSATHAEDEPKSASDSPATKPAEPVKVDGVFEALREHEVRADNEHFTTLKVDRVLPHGKAVTKGQNLIWFETEAFDKQLKDAETELRLAEIALAAEEFDYEQFLERQKLDQESAKRARDAARQAYDNYQKVDRELEIKQAENSLESSKFSLESATEEYEQLKKMYEEDDLTEESEEIVLRRAKRAMERAEFSLERAQVQHDRTIKQTIPRRDAEQEETLAKAMLDYDNTIKDIQSARQKRALEMEKKRRDFADQKSKVDEMREERKRVVLKAPMDGIFLHGKLTRGKLPAKPATIEQGATVPANQTFATIVHPNRLRVRIDLPEQHVALARTSDRCKVIPTGTTDVELDGKLSSVSSVPFATGKFDCVVSLQGKVPEYIVPTMTCAVQMTPKADDATPAESKPAK